MAWLTFDRNLNHESGRLGSAQQPYRAFDHDFPSWAKGLVIPHGINDLLRNHGHVK